MKEQLYKDSRAYKTAYSRNFKTYSSMCCPDDADISYEKPPKLGQVPHTASPKGTGKMIIYFLPKKIRGDDHLIAQKSWPSQTC